MVKNLSIEEFGQVDHSIRETVAYWQDQLTEKDPQTAMAHQLILNVATSTEQADSGRFFDVYVSILVEPVFFKKWFKWYVRYNFDWQVYNIVELDAEAFSDNYL